MKVLIHMAKLSFVPVVLKLGIKENKEKDVRRKL